MQSGPGAFPEGASTNVWEEVPVPEADVQLIAVGAIPFDINGFRGSIIDTPRFDDTHLTDTEVLRRISEWMDTTYRQGHKITGILYLREITESKMRGSSLKNLGMFLRHAWREAELRADHLQVELASGARTARHDNTRESAQAVLQLVLGNEGLKGVLADRLRKVEEMLRRVQADKALLEMAKPRQGRPEVPETAGGGGQDDGTLLSGLVTVTPLILQEWQAWKELCEIHRAEGNELAHKRWEQEMASKKRQLEIGNEIAREKDGLSLRKEAEIALMDAN
ncbi:hypothetical protein B0T24DRAFT_681955 [Lasiosphaeria ovina]|uniref:Uncharacterized protein n=1 Tax=Lasiosphaeria ovina TaxID=92902 RepID=A0AAE0N1H8_9PEZI|nr:hypothetical protein B0T24DRAFT_681955 [Lasiosphaeria ovina]